MWKIFASPCFQHERGIKMTNRDRQRQTVEKHRLFCTLLCSWSISTISDSRLESASCSNLSGAFWGDSMCCRREAERWRNYTKTWLTDFGLGLGFTLPDSGLSGQKKEAEPQLEREKELNIPGYLVRLNYTRSLNSKENHKIVIVAFDYPLDPFNWLHIANLTHQMEYFKISLIYSTHPCVGKPVWKVWKGEALKKTWRMTE